MPSWMSTSKMSVVLVLDVGTSAGGIGRSTANGANGLAACDRRAADVVTVSPLSELVEAKVHTSASE